MMVSLCSARNLTRWFGMPKESGTKGEIRLRAKLGLTFAALAVLIFRSYKPEWIPNDALSAGLLFVAALPWLVWAVEEAEFFGNKIKFRKIEQETEELRRASEETRRKLDKLIL